jgi:hypothetical protein
LYKEEKMVGGNIDEVQLSSNASVYLRGPVGDIAGFVTGTRLRSEERSGLLNTHRTTNLTLNLFTSPSSSVNGSGLEFSVLTSFPDHRGEPVSAVEVGELPMGERISEITVTVSKTSSQT